MSENKQESFCEPVNSQQQSELSGHRVWGNASPRDDAYQSQSPMTVLARSS